MIAAKPGAVASHVAGHMAYRRAGFNEASVREQPVLDNVFWQDAGCPRIVRHDNRID
jgi:hypothetical protein